MSFRLLVLFLLRSRRLGIGLRRRSLLRQLRRRLLAGLSICLFLNSNHLLALSGDYLAIDLV